VTDQGSSAPAPDSGAASLQPDRRRRLIVIGVAGAVLAAAVVAVLLLTRGGGTTRITTNADAQKVNALGPQVAQLVALLERGQTTQYHAEYRAVTPAEQTQNATMSIELWRSPPRLRQDVTVTSGGQTATSAAFLLPDGGVGCTKETAAAAWTCAPIPKQQDAAPDTLAKQITQEIGAGPVAVRSRKVAGIAVTCFDLPVSEATAQVCVTAEGIPALISSGGTRIELVHLSTDVSGDVFTPPVGAV